MFYQRVCQRAAILLSVLSVFGLLAHVSFAVAPPDPYADAVDPATSSLTIDAQRVLHAPDGNVATVAGVLGADLVLDMGVEEEGTGDLMVHYQGGQVGVITTVAFLDANKNVLTQGTLTLQAGVEPATTTVVYDRKPTPYRYVRLAATAQAYAIDAVEAATYRPDSDKDGLPDSWELQYGLNPLSASGEHGAAGDPDADGLTNIQEYTHGTDPTDPDTDGDGLPDGWEVQYGLDPLDATGPNGASGDPDGDGATNAEEYAAGTHPQQNTPSQPPTGGKTSVFLPLIHR